MLLGGSDNRNAGQRSDEKIKFLPKRQIRAVLRNRRVRDQKVILWDRSLTCQLTESLTRMALKLDKVPSRVFVSEVTVFPARLREP